VKLFVAEVGSEEMLSLIEQRVTGQLLLSTISIVELHSVIVRLLHTGHLFPEDAAQVLSAITEDWERIEQQRLGLAEITLAAAMVQKHQLRTLDAIQLACALSARLRLETEVRFVVADRALSRAAEIEGFLIYDPCEQ
jgi:predicted nucleic acid-binding protein